MPNFVGTITPPRKRTGQKAKTTTTRSRLATISQDEEFAAMNRGRLVAWQSDVPEEEDALTGKDGADPGITEGQHPDRVNMWLQTTNGWQMRVVPVTHIDDNLRNGWRSYCPDCGSRDHGGEPNDCPARTAIMYTVCPVCITPTRIYDNYQISAVSEIEKYFDDPNFVQIDALMLSTPQKRVEAGLVLHMWTRHPQETRSMGIAPMPSPDLTVLETALQTGPNSNPIIGGNAEL